MKLIYKNTELEKWNRNIELKILKSISRIRKSKIKFMTQHKDDYNSIQSFLVTDRY